MEAKNVDGLYASYGVYLMGGKHFVLCNFMFDPRVYLDKDDVPRISEKTLNELLSYCKTPAAQKCLVWNFNACSRVECQKLNGKYLDSFFEAVKKTYPDKKLIIDSNLSSHHNMDKWELSDKYCKEYGLPNAQSFNQSITKSGEIAEHFRNVDNYIVVGDQSYQKAFDQVNKTKATVHRYLTD